ncbi:MAG: hypothetical protein U1E73_03720 [Planctomycetota bacterium]
MRLPLLSLALAAAWLPAQDPARNPALHIAFVGKPDDARGKSFVQFLRQQFARVTPVAIDGCTPEKLRFADVVVVDWAQDAGVMAWLQDKKQPRMNPLGELARWDRPTVLVGSAGLNAAASWNLPGTHG